MSTSIGQYDDAILRLATAIVRGMIILLWIAIGLALLAIPGMFLWRADVVAELTRNGLSPDAVPMLALLMAGAALMLFIGTRFFGKLLALMRTVHGDPFVPENAVRLRAMAWLLLGMEVLGYLLGLISHMAVKESAGFEFSITGLIAVLSLFVLARVFTRGTELRDEIEGTI